MIFGVLSVLAAAVLVGVDQLIKRWATAVLLPKTAMTLIPGVLELRYFLNDGMAFSMLAGKQKLLIAATSLMLLGVLWMLFARKLTPLERVAWTLVLGGGIGILPSKGLVVAPADATVSVIHSTLHALGLQLDDGTELLIHVGVDTVEMNGDGFHSFVKEGDKVKKGDKLLSFDIDKIKAAGHNTTVSVIVSNSDDFKAVEGLPGDPVDLNCSVIRTVH
mgnify:FL=1